MKTRNFYLALCVLGVIVPNAPFFRWMGEHGLDARLFVRDLFANGVSSFFGLDVVLTALVVCGFVIVEGRRLRARRPPVPVAPGCVGGFGPACAASGCRSPRSASWASPWAFHSFSTSASANSTPPPEEQRCPSPC